MSNETKNKPVATLRDGLLKANIWANDSDKGTRFSVGGVIRSYTDKEGKWVETTSLHSGDILRAARLLEKAYDKLAALRESSKDGGNS
jgi:hypothetical protein